MTRSDLVVFPEPNIDSDLGLSFGVEPFCVEDFFSPGAVKAFVVSIFPKTTPKGLKLEAICEVSGISIPHNSLKYKYSSA